VIVVTGAAGFIGSCVVSALNQMGREDIIAVDQVEEVVGQKTLTDENLELKKRNLLDKKILKFYEKQDFLKLIESDGLHEPIEMFIHMGACSSTILQDEKYFEKNNFEYTKVCARWSLKHKTRFIYASSAATYGDGSSGYNDDIKTIHNCKPLNLYGCSKQKFDEWVLEQNLEDQIVGLKFFNVFGPNEYHKGEMRSVITKAYQRVVDEGKIMLFKSNTPEYDDGEQKRDFIYVKDAVAVVLFLMEHPEINGIYNCGTGEARSWNDLAKALFEAVGKPLNIEYVEMPEKLKDKYQNFTQANMGKLKAAGYSKPFMCLEDAVADYAQYLGEHRYY